MNYIGSKQRLAPWIVLSISGLLGEKQLKNVVFADLFAGTGQVGRAFKPLVKKVIANDLEAYAYALNRHYIGNTKAMDFPLIGDVSSKGAIYNGFTEAATPPRMYFTEDNAQTIDGIRAEIDRLRVNEEISEDQYFWLLTSLIECADAVANTASVYGAFLKKFKKSAERALKFGPAPYLITNQENEVYNEDANELIRAISGDVLYLDPPYNQRQYGANYHVLNRIVESTDIADQNISARITGIGQYSKSDYCSKRTAEDAMEYLVATADFPLIAISYNNEGIIPEDRFRQILEAHGKYSVVTKKYSRFKADSARNNIANSTFEFLHFLRK